MTNLIGQINEDIKVVGQIVDDFQVVGKVDISVQGRSAYDSWLSLGNTGTEADFIVSLMSEKSTYTHHQSVPTDIWEIHHTLKSYPSVTIVDSGNSVVFGEVTYVSLDLIRVAFKGEFSGVAYLN